MVRVWLLPNRDGLNFAPQRRGWVRRSVCRPPATASHIWSTLGSLLSASERATLLRCTRARALYCQIWWLEMLMFFFCLSALSLHGQTAVKWPSGARRLFCWAPFCSRAHRVSHRVFCISLLGARSRATLPLFVSRPWRARGSFFSGMVNRLPRLKKALNVSRRWKKTDAFCTFSIYQDEIGPGKPFSNTFV